MHGRDSTDMGTAHGLEFESCPIVLTIFLVTFVLLADKGNLLARNCVKIVLPATALFFFFFNSGKLWQAFNQIQKLLAKTKGKVVGDVMTPAPVVVHETTNLEDAARYMFLLLFMIHQFQLKRDFFVG